MIRPGDDGRPGLSPRKHQPLVPYDVYAADSGLFLNFIELGSDEEKYRSFADRFGLLGNGPYSNDPVAYESLELWSESVETLGRPVRLWRAVQAGDEDGLRHIVRDEDGAVYYVEWPQHPDPGFEELIGTVATPALGQGAFNDRLVYAMLFIGRQTSRYLDSGAEGGQMRGGCCQALVWDAAAGRLRLRPAPRNLWAVMWLMFARAVDEDRKYRACDRCRRWFEVSAQGGRADKAFCQTACRVAAFRDRQRQARIWVANGRPLEGIAAELGTDVATVRKWVGKP